MPQTRKLKKTTQYLGLDRLNVYKEDTLDTSQFFKVSDIPDSLPIGRSSFIIRGSKWLKKSSEIKVEVIDANGGVIYSAFVNDVEQSSGRPVTIEVYSDTPVGLATIYIVGEIKGVPDKWRGIYNARWSKKIFVDPTNFNKQPIKFIRKPKILVEEKNVLFRDFHPETTQSLQVSSSLYDGKDISFILLSDEKGLQVAIDRFPTKVKNLKKKYKTDFLSSDYLGGGEGYTIGYLKGLGETTGSFSSEMIGHKFYAKKTIKTSGSYKNYDENTYGLKEDYTGSIVDIYNDRLVLMKPALTSNEFITGSMIDNDPLTYGIRYADKSAKITSDRDWYIDYTTTPSESFTSQDQLYEGSLPNDKSYASIVCYDLNTYSGEVARLQVFTERQRAEFAEPEMIYDGVVPNKNILFEYNHPPRKLSNVGTFKTGSEYLIGSGSQWEFWYKDKVSIQPDKPITGYLTASLNSNQISGSGTLFDTELSIGDKITMESSSYSQVVSITSISSSTSMSINSNWIHPTINNLNGISDGMSTLVGGNFDGYGNYSEWTASNSSNYFIDGVELKGSVSNSNEFLRFYTSASYYFTPGKYTLEMNLYGENPEDVPDNWSGTNLFVYLSGSAFVPYSLDRDYPNYSGIEVPSSNHLGQPIASFNPQWREKNKKLFSSKLIKKQNFRKVKVYFDVGDYSGKDRKSKSGYGQLNFLVYRPNYQTSHSKWVMSDISIKPRKDVGFHPTSVRMYVPVDSRLSDDVLNFETRYLNMDNDTAVDISRKENVNFSGSNYEVGGGGSFYSTFSTTNQNSVSYNVLGLEHTPLANYLKHIYGLQNTGSLDSQANRSPIFQELWVGPTASAAFIDGRSTKSQSAAHIYWTEESGSIFEVDTYKTIEKSTVTGDWEISGNATIGQSVTSPSFSGSFSGSALNLTDVIDTDARYDAARLNSKSGSWDTTRATVDSKEDDWDEASSRAAANTQKTASWDTGQMKARFNTQKTGSWDKAKDSAAVISNFTSSYDATVVTTAGHSALITNLGFETDDTIVSGSEQISSEISGAFTDLSESLAGRIKAEVEEMDFTAAGISGSWKGQGVVSESAQLASDISGSWNTTYFSTLTSNLISGSWQGQYFSGLTADLISGSYKGDGVVSGSEQLASDISGSWLGQGIVSESAQLASEISGSWLGQGIVSESAQLSSEISGSWQGQGVVSESAQLSSEISGSWQGQYFSTLTSDLISGSWKGQGVVSESAQLSSEISGSWLGQEMISSSMTMSFANLGTEGSVSSSGGVSHFEIISASNELYVHGNTTIGNNVEVYGNISSSTAQIDVGTFGTSTVIISGSAGNITASGHYSGSDIEARAITSSKNYSKDLHISGDISQSHITNRATASFINIEGEGQNVKNIVTNLTGHSSQGKLTFTKNKIAAQVSTGLETDQEVSFVNVTASKGLNLGSSGVGIRTEGTQIQFLAPNGVSASGVWHITSPADISNNKKASGVRIYGSGASAGQIWAHSHISCSGDIFSTGDLYIGGSLNDEYQGGGGSGPPDGRGGGGGFAGWGLILKKSITSSADIFSGKEIHAEGNIVSSGSLIAYGDVIAKNYIVSSSTTYMTTSYHAGNTSWGDTNSDEHKVTGSLKVKGYVDIGHGYNTPKLDIGNAFSFNGKNGINSWISQSASDNFGIGTSSPVCTLDVVGELSASGNIKTGGNLYLHRGNGTIYGGNLYLGQADNVVFDDLQDTPLSRLTLETMNLQFNPSKEADPYARFYGDSDTLLSINDVADRIGIRTESPGATLGIKGSISASGQIDLENTQPIRWGDNTSNEIALQGANGDFKFRSGSGFGIYDMMTIGATTTGKPLVGIGNSSPTQALTVQGALSASGEVYAKTFRPCEIMSMDVTTDGSTDGNWYYVLLGSHFENGTWDSHDTNPLAPLFQTAMCDTKIKKVKLNYHFAISNIASVKMGLRKYDGSGLATADGNWTDVGTEWTITTSDVTNESRYYHAPSDWSLSAGDIWAIRHKVTLSSGTVIVLTFTGNVLLEEDWNNQVSS